MESDGGRWIISGVGILWGKEADKDRPRTLSGITLWYLFTVAKSVDRFKSLGVSGRLCVCPYDSSSLNLFLFVLSPRRGPELRVPRA